MERRGFVYSLAALALAPPVPLFGKVLEQKPASVRPLTEDEKELLGHICEQIVPADAYPGARELGAVHFIDRMLKEAHPDWVVVYRVGLRSTNISSRKLYGQRFADLDSPTQAALLKKMQRNDLDITDWAGLESGVFFGLVRAHTMHGCYSHPKWGGNRAKAAWKMIGYDDWWA